jgi:hypothetical protein
MVGLSYEITTNGIKPGQPAEAYARARSKYLTRAVEQSIAVIAAAERSLIPIGSTGEAAGSIVTRIYQLPSRLVGRVTSSFTRPKIYIYVLNYGRLPGKRPPPTDALVPWVMARGLATDEKHARQVAFLVARKIGRKGNRRGPTLTRQAYERSRGQVEAFHQAAIDGIVQELSNGNGS